MGQHLPRRAIYECIRKKANQLVCLFYEVKLL
jgi:hypothetical protein